MKNIYKLISGMAVLAAAISCDLNKTPVFDDADAFAAFGISSVSVDEDDQTVSIPVTIASINPMNVTVSYATEDGSAKAGENYSLTDESAVLVFDGKTRTQNIVININNLKGKYTGDLSFNVRLVSAGNLKVGADNVCKVTISDLDHPLASILGSYTCTGTDAGQGASEWTMNLTKDESDPTVVWMDYIVPLAASNGLDAHIYGTVSEDLKTITIPSGQSSNISSSGETLVFYNFLYDGGYYTSTESVVMTSETEGVFTSEDGICLASSTSVFGGGMIVQGTLKWTKNE